MLAKHTSDTTAMNKGTEIQVRSHPRKQPSWPFHSTSRGLCNPPFPVELRPVQAEWLLLDLSPAYWHDCLAPVSLVFPAFSTNPGTTEDSYMPVEFMNESLSGCKIARAGTMPFPDITDRWRHGDSKRNRSSPVSEGEQGILRDSQSLLQNIQIKVMLQVNVEIYLK